MISDRPFDVWLDEFRTVKDRYPDGVLIASIMEEYQRDAWIEIVERCEAAGVDAFELNFSCPHGLPERKMGSAMGQDPEILEEVCGWVMERRHPAGVGEDDAQHHAHRRAGSRRPGAGCSGLSAINTILSVMSVNLETLRPEPTVEGYTTPGGYSCKAVRPIALRMVMELATMMYGGGNGQPIEGNGRPARTGEFPDRTLSAIGGIETRRGRGAVHPAGGEHRSGVHGRDDPRIQAHPRPRRGAHRVHGTARLRDHRGLSRSQPAVLHHARRARAAAGRGQGHRAAARAGMVTRDTAWEGDRFVEQSDKLVAE